MPAPLLSSIAAAPSFSAALPIQQLEILRFDGHFFARARSGEFWGIVALGHWTPALVSLWQQVVFPFWLGRDARDLSADTEIIAQLERNYKLAGAPFWMAVAGVELALWDLLGQVSGRAVAALLADKPRTRMPIYISGSRRDISANEEIEWLANAIIISGARAAKLKIGGGAGWDEKTDSRDRELLKLARQKLGEKFVIYADASGSFEAEKAIEIGQMLREFKVAWFEEPCDWEDFEATRAVAANVQLPVAGGKNESSPHKWKWLLENCALDIAQPDIFCNGGLSRSLRVAQFAAQLGVSSAPLSPASGPQALPALHFAAAIEKPAPFLEWHARLHAPHSWFQAPLEIKKGAVSVPQSAGWGAVYDDEIWKRAEFLATASV